MSFMFPSGMLKLGQLLPWSLRPYSFGEVIKLVGSTYFEMLNMALMASVERPLLGIGFILMEERSPS